LVGLLRFFHRFRIRLNRTDYLIGIYKIKYIKMQMNKTAFRITRNILSEKMKVWALLIVFLSGANWVNAQRIFSINSEGSIQRAIQQDGQVQVTDERLGASEQAREFEYNTQLITLTKENEGDILSLDFFEDKKFNGKIQNVTRYMNGVTGITAKIDNSLFL